MKFLHTSDLHLGLRLCEMRLNEDIGHILTGIADAAVRENCDAVIVAGDIYDRTNPTPDSVAVFDRFVTSLASRGIAVLSVAGNHDSPERIAYLSSLLSENGVYFSPLYSGDMLTASLSDAFGTVYFHLLPFLRPSVLRLTCEDFDSSRTSDAVEYALAGIDFSDGCRHVIIAHQFVTGSSAYDESEMVGGTEAVPYTLFEKADYTALGHLHSPHHAGKEYIRYSGSPIKTSFAEAADEKSVTMVELGEKGDVKITPIPLTPLRDLREMRGTYMEMTSPEARAAGNPEDYLRIILTDEDDIPDVMAKLRSVYPNLLRLTYDNRRTRESRMIESDITDDCDDGALTPESVFAELYELQNNIPADGRIMDIVKKLFRETEENMI